MANKEFIINDDDSTVIQRKDIQGKIAKLEVYIKRTMQRVDQLDKQLTNIHSGGANQEQIKKGLDYFNLSQNISKQV